MAARRGLDGNRAEVNAGLMNETPGAHAAFWSEMSNIAQTETVAPR